MKSIKGSILDVKNGYICNVVNCKGLMGGGFSKELRERFPKVYNEYLEKVENRNKSLSGEIQFVYEDDGKIFVNMFSLDDCGCVGQFISKEAFEKCLIKLKKEVKENEDVYFPYGIGCEIGGGNWDTISSIIEKHFDKALVLHP